MLIELEDVCYRYEDGGSPRDALSGISLILRTGDCAGLIGPSGSGKSTLAQVLNGLHRPSFGRMLLDGKALDYRAASLRDLRRRVGLVMQQPEAQIFEATVFDEVAFAARQWSLPESELDERVHQALSRVGVDAGAFTKRDPMKLSGGEARLVTIASLLVVEPDWLILDEPTLGLDYPHTQQIRSLVTRRKDLDQGTLLISHDLDLVFELCPRVVALRDGRVAFDGDPATLFRRHDLKDEFDLEVPTKWKIRRRLAEGVAEWRDEAVDLRAELAALSPVGRAEAERILHQYLAEQSQSEAAS